MASLENRTMAISEIQQRLSSCMYSALSEIHNRGNPNDAEALIKTLDNDLELVIHTLNPDNQISAAMDVLGRAQIILENGFINDINS